jgi:hypothetical protein
MNKMHYKVNDDQGIKLLLESLRTENRFTQMLIRDAIAQHYFEQKEFKLQRLELQKALESFPLSISIRYKLVLALEPWTNRMGLLCSLLETGILIGKQEKLNGKEKQKEMEFYKLSLEKLALLYCKQNRNEEAYYVLRILGCTHRLSKHVLFYQPTTEWVDGGEFVKCFDNLLDEPSLGKLQQCFAKDAPFWIAHGYNEYESKGYFSYTFTLDSSPRNFIEQYILEMYELIQIEFPEKADKIRVAEWWAHCRPHSMGHQMHYDSENEGEGEIRHPILSSVLYLTECGGPTLVTNQVMGGPLASKGYMIYPEVNRVGIFDSKYLHGVVPGRGPKMVHERRCTFMIGFWDDITIFDKETVGAARPSPGQQSWCSGEIEMNIGEYEEKGVRSLDSVWQLIDGTEIDDYKLPMYDHCFQGF